MKSLALFFPFLATAAAFQLQHPTPTKTHQRDATLNMDRRSLLGGVAATSAGLLLGLPGIAQAGIDPSLLKALPIQGDESGAVQRLRQVESIQRPETDLTNVPFTDLPSGVSYREYREGKGEAGKETAMKDK